MSLGEAAVLVKCLLLGLYSLKLVPLHHLPALWVMTATFELSDIQL